jgi:hypothetical protein
MVLQDKPGTDGRMIGIASAEFDDVERTVFMYAQLQEGIDVSLPDVLLKSGFSAEDAARGQDLLPRMRSVVAKAKEHWGDVIIEHKDVYGQPQ